MPVVHVVVLAHLVLAGGGPPAGLHELAATFGTAPPGSTAITTIMSWLKWIGGAVSVGRDHGAGHHDDGAAPPARRRVAVGPRREGLRRDHRLELGHRALRGGAPLMAPAGRRAGGPRARGGSGPAGADKVRIACYGFAAVVAALSCWIVLTPAPPGHNASRARQGRRRPGRPHTARPASSLPRGPAVASAWDSPRRRPTSPGSSTTRSPSPTRPPRDPRW